MGYRANAGDVVTAVDVEQVIDPAHGTVLAEIPSATDDEVAHAVDIAATAFPAWSRTTPRERAEALHALADRLQAKAGGVEGRAGELGEMEARNAGKPITAMPEEIGMCVDTLRFFAGAARMGEGRAAG